MGNEQLIKYGHLNGCFGDLYLGSSGEGKFYLRCECNTENVSSSLDESGCNFCPFKGRKIKVVNLPLQKEGFGYSGKIELTEILKEVVKYQKVSEVW